MENTAAEASFTKQQLIGSKHFQHRRDVLEDLLEDDKRYTLQETQALVDEFLGKKV